MNSLAGSRPEMRIAFYPTYKCARLFLSLIEGYGRRTLLGIFDSLAKYTGKPQENRDWSDPDVWIAQVLTGSVRELAMRLWRQSEGEINPRYMSGVWLMCAWYRLCQADDHDILRISYAGQDFLQNPEGETVQSIDYSEGLLALLAIIAEQGPGKRSDLLRHFSDFVLANSHLHSPSAVSTAWYERTVNLVERGYIRRDGVFYTIESKGSAYLERAARFQQVDQAASETLQDIRKLLERQSNLVRQNLLDLLRQINPYQLEHIVKALLEAMGYVNVRVTKASGDGGVDVVGEISIGITWVREVVQVKRHQANIQRNILDSLRGSLHRFNANRGTIITTGKFTTGAKQAALEQGAAPLTLIDGERLVDLLIEHQIGARKEMVPVLKFMPKDFESDEASEEGASEVSE